LNFPPKLCWVQNIIFLLFHKGKMVEAIFTSWFQGQEKVKKANAGYLQKAQIVLFKCYLEDFGWNAHFHGKILIWRQISHFSRLKEKKCTQQTLEKSCSTVQKVDCRWCCSSSGHWRILSLRKFLLKMQWFYDLP